jgi:hypothetical protein
MMLTSLFSSLLYYPNITSLTFNSAVPPTITTTQQYNEQMNEEKRLNWKKEEECKKGNGIKGNLCIGRFRYLRVNVSKAMQFNISQNELSNSTPYGERKRGEY